jgi:hypothetical protein
MNWETINKLRPTNGQEPWEPAIRYINGSISIRRRVRDELAGRNIEVRYARHDNGKLSIMLAYSPDKNGSSRLITRKTCNISVSDLRKKIGTEGRRLAFSHRTNEGLVFTEK